jgi:fructose transport system ATP-binding protein
MTEPILKARNLVKRYGRVTASTLAISTSMPGEILAVIGDNGAGKSTLIKALSGAVIPDEGEMWLDGKPVRISLAHRCARRGDRDGLPDARHVARPCRSPTTCSWAANAQTRVAWANGAPARPPAMEKFARDKLTELGLMTIQNINQAVETLSGGQRQGVAVARAAAFGSKVIILDEPTAALGVKESRKVLELIQDVRSRGIPIILISHNMPHVFEVADRIHIHRLGKRLCVIDPKDIHDVRCGGLHDRRQGAAVNRNGGLMADTRQDSLARVLAAIRARHVPGRRLMVAIAGPPASGKSTLSADLVHALNEGTGEGSAALLPMDGYHLDNCILEQRGLLPRKGAPETFDADGFCRMVALVRAARGDIVHPVFDRKTDLAVAGAAIIARPVDIVIVEGNYLLLGDEPWRTAQSNYDLTVFVAPAIETLSDRLVARWLAHGHDRDAAIRRAEGNDLPNARLVLERSVGADIILT